MGKPDRTAMRRPGNAHAPIFGDGNQLFSDDERARASCGFKSGGIGEASRSGVIVTRRLAAIGVVRKQRIGIGLGCHRVEIGCGQAFLFQNPAHRLRRYAEGMPHRGMTAAEKSSKMAGANRPRCRSVF